MATNKEGDARLGGRSREASHLDEDYPGRTEGDRDRLSPGWSYRAASAAFTSFASSKTV